MVRARSLEARNTTSLLAFSHSLRPERPFASQPGSVSNAAVTCRYRSESGEGRLSDPTNLPEDNADASAHRHATARSRTGRYAHWLSRRSAQTAPQACPCMGPATSHHVVAGSMSTVSGHASGITYLMGTDERSSHCRQPSVHTSWRRSSASRRRFLKKRAARGRPRLSRKTYCGSTTVSMT